MASNRWQEHLESRTLFAAQLDTFTFQDLPTLGTTAAGQAVQFGGFSGLAFEGLWRNGNLRFITHTDRGPNGDPIDDRRPFLLPDFAPEIVRFELNPRTGVLSLTQRIQLSDKTGDPLTGLSNTAVAGGNTSTPFNDEVAIDLFGNVLPLDPLGGDFEGIAVDHDGSFWMVDEYRPSIYHFNKNGRLKERFVPEGTAAAAGMSAGTFGTEALPAVLGQRRQNRGFEGVAIQGGKVYAIVQSPIRNPATLSNGTLNNLQNVRVVEFDPKRETTRQFIYQMDNANLGGDLNTRADKIGDMASAGNGQFLVVERDDDSVNSGDAPATIEKKVYRFSLDGATDISGLPASFTVIRNGAAVQVSVDQMTAAELAAAGIKPAAKTLHVDLNTVGYNGVEKVEGLAVLAPNAIAVVNDNDFGVAGITIDLETGTFTRPGPEAPVILGIIRTDDPVTFPGNGDRDGGHGHGRDDDRLDLAALLSL